MRKLTVLLIIILCIALFMNFGNTSLYAQGSTKPRTIVTTDGESDDKCSFVRFLLYTTDFDIEGLIYTNSKWHLKGNGTKWMHDFIDAYAKDLPNLRLHHPDFPDPDFLKSKIYVGQMDQVGREAVGEGNDTPGSDRIVEVLLDDDPRPVWLQAWGGLNNICQAFYRIKTSYPDQVEKVNRKAIVYAIAEQDDLKNWLIYEMPGVSYILNIYQFWRVFAYAWDRKNPMQDHESYTAGWLEKNVLQKGTLGAVYDRKVMEEGDSPAFLHLIETGLKSTTDPSWGGWGGRFDRGTINFFLDAEDDGDNTKPLWRFIVPIADDFAGRMDWTVKNRYEDANHAPVVNLRHKNDLSVKAGKKVKLDASPSFDPDGDKLNFTWWQYREAGSYNGMVEITVENKSKASVKIPGDANGKTIHLICEVKDDALLPMTRYERIVINVR
jgi:hypothetical protein